MSVVTYFVETAEGYLNTAAETQFGAVAATVGTMLVLGTTLVVILVFINTIYQYRAMDGRTAFWLAVKIGLIGVFATNWVQFNILAASILSGIDSIAGSLVASVGGGSPGPSGTFAEEFDDLIAALGEYLNAAGSELNWMAGALLDTLGVLLLSILGGLAAFIVVDIAQRRISIAWDRIILPDNQTIQISSFGGDELGRSGVTGFVDTRFDERFGSAALISLISAAPSALNERGGVGWEVITAEAGDYSYTTFLKRESLATKAASE